VAAYHSRMGAAGACPGDIHSHVDLARLPYTTKADLHDSYPFGLFASPLAEIVRLNAPSGTIGKPVVAAYMREDVALSTQVMMRSLAMAGVHAGDIVQNAYGYGLFTGGLGAHYGAEGLGATVIPTSGGNTDRQIRVMKDFGVTVICCTPSYFLHLIGRAAQMGIDLRELPLRIGVFGAEPRTEAMRLRIQRLAGIRAFDIHGLSEIIGPGVGMECECRCGLHIFEDHFYPEIIDSATGAPLPEGEEGELVLTTLTKRAMPMIRYRTRDITAFIPEPCPCGRTLRRIRRIGRRSNDMLIIRGVDVFPSQVEAALVEAEHTLPHCQMVLTRAHGLDQMEVQVEVTPESFSDRVGALEELGGKIAEALERVIGLRV